MKNIIKSSFLFLFAVLLVLLSATDIGDPDTVQYIANGKHILKSGFSKLCVYSYSSNNCQIPYSEWLTHVITYFIYSLFSWKGLVVTQVLLVLSIFGVLLKYVIKNGYNLPSSVFIFSIAAFSASDRFIYRADLFALLLGTILFVYLEQNHSTEITNKKSFFKFFTPIGILLLLWANMHGSFPLGLVILSSYTLEKIWKLYQSRNNRKEIGVKKNNLYVWLIILSLALVVSLLNPYGLEAFLWPFKFFFGDKEFYSQVEFLSPFSFKEIQPVYFYGYLLLLLVTFTTLFLRAFKLQLRHIIVVIPFIYLSFKANRNIPWLGVVTSVILPFYLNELNALKTWKYFKHLQYIALGASFLFIGLFMKSLFSGDYYQKQLSTQRFGFSQNPVIFSSGGVDFIKTRSLKGNMFNDYRGGTYINFALFPSRKNFIDGHSYTLEKLNYYKDVVSGKIDLNEVVQKYNINYFFLEHGVEDTGLLISKLSKDPNWVLVYFDEVSCIFVKKSDNNQEVISKDAINFNLLYREGKLPLLRKDYHERYASLARSYRGAFLFRIDQLNASRLELESAVELDPNNFTALNVLGLVYGKLNLPEKAEFSFKNSLNIQEMAQTHGNYGILLENLGRKSEAISEYKKALTLNPGVPAVSSRLEKLNK